jgi:TPR repeat protein
MPAYAPFLARGQQHGSLTHMPVGIGIGDITTFLSAPFTIAALFLTLTAFALSLMAVDKKETLALWLMGAGGEQTWSRGYLNMFDAIFGDKHLSVRCLIRSSILSVLFVSVIWGLMIWSGTISTRGSLGQWNWTEALLIGVAVNMVADYVSLLETRFLLGKLPNIRNGFWQAAVLLFDLFITAAIIIAVIWVVQQLGLFSGDYDDPLAVILAFSIFTAPFYSTFLTSIWTWAYVLAIWTLRLFSRFRLARWLDIEHQSTLILSIVLSGFVLLGALGGSFLLKEGPSGYSRLDIAVCSIFQGDICNRVKRLAKTDEDRFLLQIYACRGGVTNDCLIDGFQQFSIAPKRAIELLGAACNGGELLGCTYLGFIRHKGAGETAVDLERAAQLYDQACKGGEMGGCSNLGVLLEAGFGDTVADQARAAQLYDQACKGGEMGGCSNLGVLLEAGFGDTVADQARAAQLYDQACNSGEMAGCSNLGILLRSGFGDTAPDPARAAQLYDQACKGGEMGGCVNLGVLLESGFGDTVADQARAAQLYDQACKGGQIKGCANLGDLLKSGFGDTDPDPARRLNSTIRPVKVGESRLARTSGI